MASPSAHEIDRDGSRKRFDFVANPQPVIRGAFGGVAILAVFFAWALATGRVRNVDATYLSVVVGGSAASVAFVVSNTLKNAKRAAAALGHVEIDARGIRWCRPEAAPVFDATWTEIERATVEPKNATLILHRLGAAPLVLGIFSPDGIPSGYVIPGKFEEIRALVEAKVPCATHRGSASPAAGARVAKIGALGCLVAVGLYGANQMLAAAFGWKDLLVHMPIFVGAVALLQIFAAVRLRAGKGPLVSPLYGDAYGKTFARFLFVASISNFVLVIVWNLVAHR